MQKSEKKSPENPEQQGHIGHHKGNKERSKIKEIGGADGPEPTRYGDWEKKGRCYDL